MPLRNVSGAERSRARLTRFDMIRVILAGAALGGCSQRDLSGLRERIFGTVRDISRD